MSCAEAAGLEEYPELLTWGQELSRHRAQPGQATKGCTQSPPPPMLGTRSLQPPPGSSVISCLLLNAVRPQAATAVCMASR